MEVTCPFYFPSERVFFLGCGDFPYPEKTDQGRSSLFWWSTAAPVWLSRDTTTDWDTQDGRFSGLRFCGFLGP